VALGDVCESSTLGTISSLPDSISLSRSSYSSGDARSMARERHQAKTQRTMTYRMRCGVDNSTIGFNTLCAARGEVSALDD
jgi:hypothetical protein